MLNLAVAYNDRKPQPRPLPTALCLDCHRKMPPTSMFRFTVGVAHPGSLMACKRCGAQTLGRVEWVGK